MTHGLTAYKSGLCRCRVCREANTAHAREIRRLDREFKRNPWRETWAKKEASNG